MSSLNDLKKDRVHTRRIFLETFDAEDDCIIVEGELLDERLFEIFHITGGKRPKGTIHHMKVRMLVGPPGFTIRDIEVEMPTIPRNECPETMESLQKVKGMTISAGFTGRIKALLGGREGCAHLTALLISMGPEAVQGYFANKARNPIEDATQNMKEIIVVSMKDTCHVWREDGPYYQEMIRSLER